MQTKYDTGQKIYVPLTVNSAMTIGGEVYYNVEETVEEIVSTVIPEYGIVEANGITYFDYETATKYRKEKNAL